MKTSEQIRDRLLLDRKPFFANDSIAHALWPGDLDKLEVEVAEAFQGVLKALVIDVHRDHNTKRTAERVAKMYIREIFKGRYEEMPALTEFPNAKRMDELYTVGPISVRSSCSHHFCSIEGQAWCGVIPGTSVIGLSKFTRLTDWVMSRPQIQEEATVQLADVIEAAIEPRALAIVVRASHSCMTMRGVKDGDTTMTTSVMRGLFDDDAAAKAEFFTLIRAQGFK